MQSESSQHDRSRTKHRLDPIFPVTDMKRSLEHYRSLGFQTKEYSGEYAFVNWPEGGCIHLALQPDLDPKVGAAAAYLYVDDADALVERWRQECPSADVRDVVQTDYGMREGAQLDPDNNLIRFGSEAERNT